MQAAEQCRLVIKPMGREFVVETSSYYFSDVANPTGKRLKYNKHYIRLVLTEEWNCSSGKSKKMFKEF